MANQIIIDIGAVANDGTGDPLRTAFGYVNDNFSNIWSTGVANSNVAFDGNKILTVNTNGNLVLAPNGTGKVVANVDIVPNTANTRNLGALTNRWSTVYTQYLNVSSDVDFAGDVTINGNLTVEGDTIQIGNIVTDTKTIQLANTASTANSANGSGITVGANDNIATMLYNSTSNTWVMNIGANITGNVTAPYFIGNGSQLTGITSYANANAVAYGQAGWAGNIIPATSNTYSLGNATHQWNDLYVSNATIYMNNVPISLTAGNTLTVNGADVVTTSANGEANIGNLEIAGATISIASGAPETDLYLSPSGESWGFLQLPTNDTANVTNTRLHNDAGNVEIGAGDLSNGGNSYEWEFDKTGNLNLPNNGSINFNGGSIVQSVDEDFTILVQDADDDGFRVQLNVDDGAGTTLSSYQQQRDRFEFRFSNGNNFQFSDVSRMILPPAAEIWTDVSSNASIIARSVDATSFVELMTQDNSDVKRSNVTLTRDTANITTGSGAYTWSFGVDGTLTTPGDIHVGNGVAAVEYNAGGNRITITSDTANNRTGASFTLNADANVYANANVRITSDSGTTAREWLFDNTGNLFVPGNIVANDTILIDNRESGVIADISIYSADNILLQGADRTNPGEPEGGDISILGGAGAADSGPGDASGGGDILIEGGSGGAANVYPGASGGFINITAGRGGDGSVANVAGDGGSIEISAGDGGSDNGNGGSGGGSISLLAGDSTDTTQDRGSITLVSGSGGDETTAGGYVEINIPSVGTNPGGSWIFTGSGTVLETPNNAEIFNVNAGNLTVGSAGNTIVRTIGAGLTTYDWVFDPTGDLIVPGGNTEIYVANAVGNVAGNSISITGGDADQTAYYATAGGNVNISGGLGAFNDGGGGGQGGSINLTAGLSADPAGVAGNVNINIGSDTWTFDNTGNLTVPGNIIGDGSALTSITGANVTGTVAQATLSNTVSVSSVLLNQEYVPALLVANTGNLGIKAADGTANITYNPSLNRLTVENIDANTVSLGNASTITTADYAIGYRDIPQVSFTGNATIATTDAGKHYYSTQSSNYTLTIANNASQGFQVGSAITIVNQGTGTITVAQGSGVALYMAGNATSGNRSVATFGMATLIKVATDTWFINGTGVS